MAVERRSSRKRATSKFSDSMLLGDSAAGILLSGDSGCGKSNGMEVLLQRLIAGRHGLTLIDPHGDLAEAMERYCAAQPESVRRRVVVIRYADTTRVAGMNPLFVDKTGLHPLVYKARVTSKVGQVARVLLHAFGERDFHGKPLLNKWMHRFLTTLALTGLTLVDVRHFFSVHSPVFEALAAAAPDFVGRLELEGLAGLRASEVEEQIGSTKSRFLNFLENMIVELALGKPDGHLNIPRLIQERAIILIDLSRGGVLRDEDVEIFANLWLSEILFAIYNTPREQRVPHFLALDELPTFQSSFEVITRSLAQVRKFQARFICAFQGTQLFEDRQQDPLLNALIGQCGVHFYFRHKNPVDARFFGEIIKLPSIETQKEKLKLTQLQQYQDGNELLTLTDTSENFSDAEQTGTSQSDGTSETATESSGASSSTGDSESRVADAVSRAISAQQGRTSGRSSAQASTSSAGSSQSTTKTRGGSITHKTTLVPRIRTREVVTSIQYFTSEEQLIESARDLTPDSRPVAAFTTSQGRA